MSIRERELKEKDANTPQVHTEVWIDNEDPLIKGKETEKMFGDVHKEYSPGGKVDWATPSEDTRDGRPGRVFTITDHGEQKAQADRLKERARIRR